MSQFSPYTVRTTQNLKKDDERVRIVGNITKMLTKDSDHALFSLKDKYGTIQIIVPENLLKNFNEGALIRVLGTLSFETDGSMHIIADILQDMAGLDLDLYHKAIGLAAELQD